MVLRQEREKPRVHDFRYGIVLNELMDALSYNNNIS